MGSEGRSKIAIVGGGPAGLAAAFEVTKPGRVPGDCVTIYQAGWRLGGKCATGRDDRRRIVEHGLHLWFGYYENAFRLLREVYAELPEGPRRFCDWTDAFQPVRSTQIGDPRFAGDRPFLPLLWPTREGSPGDGRQPRFWDSVTGVLRILSQFHDALADEVSPTAEIVAMDPQYARAFGFPPSTSAGSPREALRCACEWSAMIAAGFSDRVHVIGLKALLRAAEDVLRRTPAKDAKDRLLAETANIATAFVGGLIDGVVVDRTSLVELDEMDFRDWLVDNGADDRAVDESPLVNALYDTMFQYGDGEHAHPSYGAGTAAQVVLRLLGGYKGDAVWKANAGLGEALIAPLYQVLKARGVKFEFFHKLDRIELTEDRTAVARLHFSRQADVAEGAFIPTFDFKGLTCWPDRPPALLSKGRDGVASDDFESRWCTAKATTDRVLDQGSDFAEVILAIPLGAFKRFRGDAGPCDELIRANPRFRAMTETIGLVPSLSAQIWSRASLAELGWREETAAMVSGPQPLQIWADMSQTLECEGWSEDGPKSVHYFCNVFASRAYRDPAAVGEAGDTARGLTAKWLETRAGRIWPNAVESASGGFNWAALEDPRDRPGSRRLEAQVVKANVDPSACCCGSAAGATAWRLKTDGAGFRHLYLAGAWIDTGFNTECIEAAVMSGKQASRAICGSPAVVDGENFLLPGKSAGFGPLDLARDVLTALAFTRA